ncbi:carbohydrate esterase [Coniothyrium glycines]
MISVAAASLLLLDSSFASPLSSSQSCSVIHVFGARETTAPTGYGTTGVAVNLILNAYPGATSEAINYPVCGGQSSCGSISYASSVQQGIAAVTMAVNAFNTKCPSTQLAVGGYSQVS